MNKIVLMRRLQIAIAACAAISIMVSGWQGSAFSVETKPRDTIRMRVVAVNPSSTKTRTVPVKVYLPQEVKPLDIVNQGGLDIEYDSEKSQYYAFNQGIQLAPKQTRIFEIEVSDVWYIPVDQLDGLRSQTEFVLKKLEQTEYFESAQKLADAIYRSLDVVTTTQNDETVSRKRHIGIYRNNVELVAQIREDIASLERLLTLASAPPVPEVLEQSQIKTESPDRTTTWMIIFVIMLFIGMLAGVFFFTWHAQSRFTKDLIAKTKESSFPESSAGPSPEAEKQQKVPPK